MLIENEVIQALVYKGEDLCDLVLYPEQHEVYKKYQEAISGDLFTVIVATFARKSGKTFMAVCIAIQVCLSTDKANVLYAAPTREMLKKFVIPVIDEVMAFIPKEFRPKKNGYSYQFEHNGSILRIEGSDYKNGDELRGPKAHLVVVDEAGFVKADLIDLIKSIFSPMVENINGKILICSTPPRTIAHKYYQVVLEAMEEGRHILKTIFDCTEYKTRPHKIKKIIKDSRGEDSVYFRREYKCEFITDPTARIIPEFRSGIHDVLEEQHKKLPEFFQPYTMIDWGYKHNTAVVFCEYYYDIGKAVVVDEITVKAKTTREIAELIKAKEKKLWGEYLTNNPHLKVRRYGDNDLQLCADMTRDHLLTVGAIRKIALDATVKQLRDRINTLFIIKSNCKNTRWQLENGVWDDKRKKFEEGLNAPKEGREELDEFMEDDMVGHCDNLAALMYLNRYINTRDNPRPPYMLNSETKATRNLSVNPQGNNNVRKIFKVRKF